MTSFNLRFITPFVVAAGLMLVLVACGNKVELPQTEAAAIAYVKSKVLAYYHRHPDRFSREHTPALISLTWQTGLRVRQAPDVGLSMRWVESFLSLQAHSIQRLGRGSKSHKQGAAVTPPIRSWTTVRSFHPLCLVGTQLVADIGVGTPIRNLDKL